MIRKIVVPQERTYVLELPEEFVGKEVELLAFEVNNPSMVPPSEKSVEALHDRFKEFTFNSEGTYKFDRNEATDYE